MLEVNARESCVRSGLLRVVEKEGNDGIATIESVPSMYFACLVGHSDRSFLLAHLLKSRLPVPF
jgi:hypothetical protein